jgi:proteasome lid subunit RPN8/RPN11
MPSPDIVVHVSHLAFTQMTLATVASYDVPQRKRTKRFVRSHECCGLLWGRRYRVPGGAVVHAVEFATVDTHAEAARTWVEPSQRFRDKMTECVRALRPSSRLIGDFHSHPYRDRADFTAPGFSEDDRAEIEDNDAEKFRRLGMRVFLVTSIYRLRRAARTKPRRGPRNIVSWSLGPYRLILAAYVAIAAARPGPDSLALLPRHRDWPSKITRRARAASRVTLSIGNGVMRAGVRSHQLP